MYKIYQKFKFENSNGIWVNMGLVGRRLLCRNVTVLQGRAKTTKLLKIKALKFPRILKKKKVFLVDA